MNIASRLKKMGYRSAIVTNDKKNEGVTHTLKNKFGNTIDVYKTDNAEYICVYGDPFSFDGFPMTIDLKDVADIKEACKILQL